MTGLGLRKQILVKAPQAEAFRLFTEGIGEWWPLHTYSVHEDRSRPGGVRAATRRSHL